MGTIAEEITRLQSAKTDIRNALTNFRLDIPESETLDKYSSYITKCHPYGIGIEMRHDISIFNVNITSIDFWAKMRATGEYVLIGNIPVVFEGFDVYYFSGLIYWPEEDCDLFFSLDYTGEAFTVTGHSNSIWTMSGMSEIFNSYDTEVSAPNINKFPITESTSMQKNYYEFINGWTGLFLYLDIFQGKACLSPDTLIKTKDGLKVISELEEGMQLNDNYGKVEKIVQHIRDSYYNIVLSDGSIIKASNDHRFVLKDNIIAVSEELSAGMILGNDLEIESIELVSNKVKLYEIKTTSNYYQLFNNIECECENI